MTVAQEQSATNGDHLWNREQAASYLGVTPRWMANTGRHLGIPQLRIGGLVRYQPNQLKQWASQQTG